MSIEQEQHAQQGGTYPGGDGRGEGGKQVKQIRIQMVTHLASVLHAWRGGSASV